MTTPDYAAMAREFLLSIGNRNALDHRTLTELLTRVASDATAVEREACAAVCDRYHADYAAAVDEAAGTDMDEIIGGRDVSGRLAVDIRARSEGAR